MEILFLGSSAGLSSCKDNFNSNIAVIDGDQILLIDCGYDIQLSLEQQMLTLDDIGSIFITHLHSDHVGGLELMGFSRKYSSTIQEAPTLFLPVTLEAPLWDNILSGGMASTAIEKSDLSSYFNVQSIAANQKFSWQHVDFYPVQVVHIMNGYALSPSFGLFFNMHGKRVFFTGDTQFCPDLLMPFYQQADIIFHDCENADIPSHVHAYYNSLKLLPKKVKKKIWLYHYNQDFTSDVKKDGFQGFVTRGQVFNLNNG